MHYDPVCKCQKPHKAKFVCINPHCRFPNPFSAPECQTNRHPNCQSMPYIQMIKKFRKIQSLYQNVFIKYEEKVQNTFQELMGKLRQQFVSFRQEFQTYNATENILAVYRQLKRKKPDELSGSIIAKALAGKPIQNLKYQFRNELGMKLLRKQIVQDHFYHVIEKLPIYYSIKRQIKLEDQSCQEDNQIMKIYDKFIQGQPLKKKPGGLLDQYITTLQKHLDKEVFGVQRLYKATQNQFSAAKFHQKCNGIKPTLTILKTQFGKIVAGYSTIPWMSPSSWQYFEDPLKQCFIFSCSKQLNGYKMAVTDFEGRSKFAIGMHKDYGPVFGEDIIIYDKAHISKSCWSNFPDVYSKSHKQLPHTIQVLKLFVGANDHFKKFNLVQWEVYKVNFSKGDQLPPQFVRQFDEI